MSSRLADALATRYRIERQLGAGGMATVYLAHDLKHDRDVAIKVLHEELAVALGGERFLSEIRTTARLQHPHILPLLDSGDAAGLLYYVMPHIAGETLRSRLDRERQLPVEDALRIAREVADALSSAHALGVIHRDIKPENILLQGGHALVADFGIALAVQQAGGERMTQTGLSLGTPQYMSPEQAMGERSVDARSDIYSLGAVTYEMLTGDPPFTGSSVQAIVARVMTEKPPPIHTVRDTVPGHVEAAIFQALAKLPADRFSSASAFSEALSGAGATTRTWQPGPMVRTWWREPQAIALLTVTILSLGGALAMASRAMSRAPGLDGITIAQRTYHEETIFNARWAPDGRTIVYSSARGGSLTTSEAGRINGTSPRIYVIRPDYPEPQPFGPDTAHLLAVSSRSEVAMLMHPRFVSHRMFVGTLARMPLGGGAPREVVENVREADWSPDGAQLAVTRSFDDRDVLEYPLGKKLYTSPRGGYLSDPRVSADGDRVAFFVHPARYDDRGVIVIVNAAGRADTLPGEYGGLEGLAWDADLKSVLFTAARGSPYQLRRAAPGVESRIVLPTPGRFTIHDANRDGHWLATRDDTPARLLASQPQGGLRDLSWLDGSIAPLISGDGQLVAFTDQGDQSGVLYGVMLRRTDGTPAVRLGDGGARGISPDNRWVLAQLPGKQDFRLYPTGAGDMHRLAFAGLEDITRVAFLPNSQSMFVCGTATPLKKSPRCYRHPIGSATLEEVTTQDLGRGELRPDGRAVAIRRDSAWWVVPFDSSAPRVIPGLKAARVNRWSPDGKALWITDLMEGVLRVVSVDVVTGGRRPLVTLEMPRGAPISSISSISIADNPQRYVYQAVSYLSLLFAIQGAR